MSQSLVSSRTSRPEKCDVSRRFLSRRNPRVLDFGRRFHDSSAILRNTILRIRPVVVLDHGHDGLVQFICVEIHQPAYLTRSRQVTGASL